MYASSEGAGALGVLVLILGIAWAIVIVVAVIVWLRVGLRWLQLNPAPTNPYASSQPPLYGPGGTVPPPAPGQAYPPSREETEALRAWAASGEGPSATARRLGVSGATAAQVRGLAYKAAAGNASAEEWAQLVPWLPKLLS